MDHEANHNPTFLPTSDHIPTLLQEQYHLTDLKMSVS